MNAGIILRLYCLVSRGAAGCQFTTAPAFCACTRRTQWNHQSCVNQLSCVRDSRFQKTPASSYFRYSLAASYLREVPQHDAAYAALPHERRDHPQLPARHKARQQLQHAGVVKAPHERGLTNQPSLQALRNANHQGRAIGHMSDH